MSLETYFIRSVSENTQKDERSKQKESYLPRKLSNRGLCSTSFSNIPEKDKREQKPVVRCIRKSVTMALLEDTNPFYKKKILFLPKPYDHFTHEATKILKFIFDKEAGITSQCCYDRSIHKHYMTSNRDRWINNVLGDHDRILIFLCFKSLSAPPNEEKYEPMVDEILDNLLLSKVASTRLCKIVFLYFTESSKNIQKKHHGDNFHIHDTSSFQNFVCDVLNFCGRSQDQYSDMIYKILHCQASGHFLKYIGLTGSPHSK
jgi:hypothetical protein